MNWYAALVFEDGSEVEIPWTFDTENEAFNEGLDYGDENYGYSGAIRVWNDEDPDNDHLYRQS